jgi:DNA modification methylase
VKPYYEDSSVTLYHGDCREITVWLVADVLVTDPPYGIGWRRGKQVGVHVDHGHSGITGDTDTATRDAAANLWADRPGLMFGSFDAPEPPGVRHRLVYRKPPQSGVVGSTTGWRRDLEPIYLLGAWPRRPARWSSLVASISPCAGGPGSAAGRYGHPHAKPVDVMEQLIAACPHGVIADPFAGSGSTLVAARNLGRQAIGVELEERYCEIAARRLQADVLPIAALGLEHADQYREGA